MYRHILIPTDGSELATLALEKGFALAAEIRAKVLVLTATEPFHAVTVDPEQIERTQAEHDQVAHQQAEAVLADAKLKARAFGIPCETVAVECEAPYRAIVDTAERRECDLIAMASHGRKGLMRWCSAARRRKSSPIPPFRFWSSARWRA